jgi:hypothetical protein
MSRSIAILMALALALAAGAANGQGPADAGMLLLRNGNVLYGRVVRTGDFYAIELAEGGSLRLPATQVEMACRDLPDAYRTKLANLGTPSPQARLDLAEWCLKQGLAAEATEQVVAAARVDPANPRVQVLERKLLALAEKAAQPVVAAAPAPAKGPEAAHDQPAAISAVATAAFTSNIQPLLVNRCGATTCHGGKPNGGFQITRSPFGPASSQRWTQRNLAAVLALVRKDAPEQSKLLTVPRAAHGSAKTPIFGDREEHQWHELLRWVAIVTNPDGQPAAPATIAVDSEPDGSLPTIPTKPPRGAALKPAVIGPPAGIEATRPPWLARPSGPLPPLPPHEPASEKHPAAKPPVPSAPPPSPITPRPPMPMPATSGDPFDPELFNRLPAEPEKK